MALPYSRTKVQAFTSTAASIKLSGKGSQLIFISDQDCWVNFNATAEVSNGLLIPADVQVTIDIFGVTNVSVIRDSADGSLSILELANSVLFNRVRGWFTAGASLMKVGLPTITGNSNLKRIVSSTITGDSNLKKSVSSTMTGDSSIEKIIPGTISGDSSIKKIVSSTITGDSNLDI